jgi:hypothetical protein
MVLGLQSPNRSPVNNALAFCGGFMITGALLIIYFSIAKHIASRP